MKKFTLLLALAGLLVGAGWVAAGPGIRSNGNITFPTGYSLIAGSTTLSETELGRTDGLTAGAATASKAVVLDSSRGFAGWTKTVAAKTTDYTVVAASDSGKVFTTTGASATVTFALPAATVGQEYFFRVGAAQELRLDPNGSETIALPSTGVAGAAGKYLTADASGETVHIICTVAGSWSVMGYTGTWTAEA